FASLSIVARGALTIANSAATNSPFISTSPATISVGVMAASNGSGIAILPAHRRHHEPVHRTPAQCLHLDAHAVHDEHVAHHRQAPEALHHETADRVRVGLPMHADPRRRF